LASVFYLCHPPEDSDTLVFATELPENFYSPGIFVVEGATRGTRLGPTYKFLAREGQQTLYLELKQIEKGRTYIVDAGHNGAFYFKAISLNRDIRYSGQHQSLFNYFPLYRIQPANMTQLERACIERDFYFIGSSGD